MADLGPFTGKAKGKGKQKTGTGENDPQSDGAKVVDHETYISNRLQKYKEYNLMDEDLWETYRTDFRGWEEENFAQCDTGLLMTLRTTLRQNGVWVKKSFDNPVHQSLYETAISSIPRIWTRTEMQAHLDAEGPFNSRRIKEYLRQQQLTSTTPKVPPPINPHQIPLPETPPHPGSLGLPQGGTPSPTPHQSPGLGRPRFGDQPDYGFGNQNEFENDIGNDLDYNGGNDYGSGLNRALANLAKMYKEKLQYGGENDNFDFKLTIFRDLCKRAGIPLTARNLAYPAMLRDLALEHYYINLNNTSEIPPFEELCDKTRNYFEGPEYRRSILGQWEV